MIIARTDVCAPHEFAFEAYNMAKEPKRLLITEGGHFGLYGGQGLAISAGAARDHFVEYLIGTGVASPSASARQLSNN